MADKLFERLLVGKILKPIGLKGLVKIQSFMSSSEAFLKQVTFYTKNGVKIYINNLKYIQSDKFSGSIDGVNNYNDADKYRLVDLYISRDTLPQLTDGEYYFDDLAGLSVYDEDNVLVGEVRIALNYGAGTFLEISTNNGKIATIPFNKNAIIEVDLKSNKVIVNKDFLLQ